MGTVKLNEQQQQAVDSKAKKILVLAGAGTGKTRVLVSRIRRVLKDGVSIKEILAITFTRKAAQEMRKRLLKHLPENTVKQMYIGTSHSFCLRLLRQWASCVGLAPNFTIYDGEDRRDVINSILIDRHSKLTFKMFDKIYRSIKNNQNQKVADIKEYAEYNIVEKAYKARLREWGAVDYDMILELAVKIIKKNPRALAYYQGRFRYIFYDEYQDIAELEDGLCLTLAINNSFVVGDPDQNIYTFRGTDIKYILGHKDRHPDLEIINLEENYRSEATICDVANKLIKHNKNRADKELIPTRERETETVGYTPCEDSENECHIISGGITNFEVKGYKYKDMAILCRTNKQAYRIAHYLQENTNIPHKIISRDTFWSNPAIRNVIFYLRVMQNPDDDFNMERILRSPHLGLDTYAIRQLKSEAIMSEGSMYDVYVKKFGRENIELHIREDIDEIPIENIIGNFITNSITNNNGYINWLSQQSMTSKIDRINKLFTEKIPEFYKAQPDVKHNLENFLDNIAQIEATDKIEKEEDVVNIMTVHCAKGLEYPVVIIAGCEDGKFPIIDQTYDNIEEERRLMYVAITRAMDHVVFTYAKERRSYGKVEEYTRSRFLKEMGF